MEVAGQLICCGISLYAKARNPYFQIAKIMVLESQNKVTIFNRLVEECLIYR